QTGHQPAPAILHLDEGRITVLSPSMGVHHRKERGLSRPQECSRKRVLRKSSSAIEPGGLPHPGKAALCPITSESAGVERWAFLCLATGQPGRHSTLSLFRPATQALAESSRQESGPDGAGSILA